VEAVRRRPPRSLGLSFSLWTLRVGWPTTTWPSRPASGCRVRDRPGAPEKAQGIVLSRPQHTITSPDPEYALKKRRSKKPATTSQKEETSSTTTPTSSTELDAHPQGDVGSEGPEQVMIQTPAQPKKRY
jgi:hypothetical protein